MKTCRVCKLPKVLSQFYRDRGRPFGRSDECVSCNKNRRSNKNTRPPQIIEPFPEDIDRTAFGHWLSGLTDGEGHFGLVNHPVRHKNGQTYHMPGARFQIILRSDDSAILGLIQRFFGIGRFHDRSDKCHLGRGNTKPGSAFTVSKSAELALVVSPHFDAFPLRAKKANDFQIWKRGVALLYSVTSRQRSFIDGRRGQTAKWTEGEKSEFFRLQRELREVRKFK